jgi:hypothetical protein
MMINPGTYNITAYQGADFDQQFVVSQGGTALNWTGYTAAMQVREAFDSPTTLLSLTNGSGITLGGTAGTITVAITNAQSAAIPAGSFSYDLELIAGAGQVTRILQGSFNVVGNVTR